MSRGYMIAGKALSVLGKLSFFAAGLCFFFGGGIYASIYRLDRVGSEGVGIFGAACFGALALIFYWYGSICNEKAGIKTPVRRRR